MGLFDFAKDLGKKIFDKDADATKISAAVTKEVSSNNPGVDDLDIKVENGVAKITGKASTAEAIEKVILMAGNISGIERVESSVSGPAVDENATYHVVGPGDSLWKLAEQYYGNGAKYTEIFEANKEVIKDPDLIFDGQKIKIPNAR